MHWKLWKPRTPERKFDKEAWVSLTLWRKAWNGLGVLAEKEHASRFRRAAIQRRIEQAAPLGRIGQ